MTTDQWLTAGVSVMQLLLVPAAGVCIRYIIAVEKRLTRIETKLGIPQ
ncbi:hypothetical protein [Burkholderia perseverans]|nr:hypothetical protein [Burkholderia perseverans]